MRGELTEDVGDEPDGRAEQLKSEDKMLSLSRLLQGDVTDVVVDNADGVDERLRAEDRLVCLARLAARWALLLTL